MTAYDLAYALAIGATAPFWLLSPKLRPKVLDALRQRTGQVTPAVSTAPAILIHAVSMGEINATTALVRELSAARPEVRFIISTTSRTGQERARQLYEANPKVTRIRFPFDFSGPVSQMLDAQKPTVAVLMELEVWPNFVRECERRNIPILLINGRLSAHSFRGYSLAAPLTRRMFARLTLACAQDEVYADRFHKVGVAPERIRVTGTMKFDTAEIAEVIPGADRLAQSVGLRPGQESIWICGSTGPGEEEIILQTYAACRTRFPDLRLAIIPRHPQRFDEVAELIRSRGFPIVRRSQVSSAAALPGQIDVPAVILGDTMGELRMFYSLADVVFVGRTLLDLGPKQHGSDMIEPAALAKPVVVGPFTGNFSDVVARFRKANAIIEIADESQLRVTVERLFSSRAEAQNIGHRAQDAVRQNQGATQRHVSAIIEYVPMSSQANPGSPAATLAGGKG